MPLPAAIPIGLLLKYLLAAGSTALTADMVSGILGGPTIGKLTGSDPEAANAERDKYQAEELTKFRQKEQMNAYADEFAGSMMVDPNEVATLGSVLQSGLFDDEMASPQQNLLNYVAREMGTTPETLSARTRRRSPFQQIRGY